LLLFAVSCPIPADPDDEIHTPSPDGKTYLNFINSTGFEVNVYVDVPPTAGALPFTNTPIPGNGNRQLAISPSPTVNGNVFYFEYLISLGSVTIPHYDAASVRPHRILDGEITSINIPPLTSNTTTSKFLVVENDSDIDIWVQDGSITLYPHGQQEQEIRGIRPGENGVFILPQSVTVLSNYNVGAFINRRNIPVTTVQAGRIYAFKYDGSSVYLYSESHFNFDDRRKIWSIPTKTDTGQYLLMGKQKPRRNPADGIVIVGRLQYDLDIIDNSVAYFALLNQYGVVTRERTFTFPNNPVIRFDEVHERQNGDFIISYFAEYNICPDVYYGDEYYTRAFLMCMDEGGVTRWQVEFNESLNMEFDPDLIDIRLRYIAEKDDKTFAVGGEIRDIRNDGTYVGSFVTEVKENAMGTNAFFSWSSHYISEFVLYEEGGNLILTEISCRDLVYNSAQDVYIAVEFFTENKNNKGMYRILRAADGEIIGQNLPNEYDRFSFLGINQVGDKYYVYGLYLDVNEKYSAAILRFNSDMTRDSGFPVRFFPSDIGASEFKTSTADDKKVVFAGHIFNQDMMIPWTYAIDRNTGIKLWENTYDDFLNHTVWNVEINSIGTLQLELYDFWGDTASSLIASTDLFGRINSERLAPIPRNPALTIITPSYTVTYNINGGTGTTPVSQSINAGDSVILASGNGFARNGFTFIGWNTEVDGSGTNYTAGSSLAPTSSMTLFANWITAYTVTYNFNGGTGTTPISQTVVAGSSVVLASGSGFSRSGFTFDGWNTNASGTGTDYSAGSPFMPTRNITLFTIWDVGNDSGISGGSGGNIGGSGGNNGGTNSVPLWAQGTWYETPSIVNYILITSSQLKMRNIESFVDTAI
jgi:hypothetical protein